MFAEFEFRVKVLKLCSFHDCETLQTSIDVFTELRIVRLRGEYQSNADKYHERWL